MSQRVEQDLERRQQWSALMDGEVDAPSAARLCSAWRDDGAARQCWHAWHLVGDVLRSEDLASAASRDERFLAALRARLGDEPVVLAPQPLPVRSSHRAWAGAAAVAAGFVAVVGAVLVMNTAPQQAAAPVLANAPAAAPALAAMAPPVPLAAAAPEPRVLTADGQLIRDARLDRYLAAHKPLGGNPALAMPTGFVRARAANNADGAR